MKGNGTFLLSTQLFAFWYTLHATHPDKLAGQTLHSCMQ